MKNIMPHVSKNTTSGFTLIELLIVVTLSVLLMLGASTLFMTLIIGSTKTSIDQTIKKEGNYALGQIEFLLRNADQLLDNGLGQICTLGMGTIKLQMLNESVVTLTTDNNKIASVSGTPTTYYLTSGQSQISTPLNFDCWSGANNSYYIEPSFSLKIGSSASRDKETSIEDFSTGITLRNRD